MSKNHHPRGYALVFVVVMGVVLAALSSILLFATARDNQEARQQLNSVRSLYAAESAVAVGIESVRSELERNTSPDLAALETTSRALVIGALPGVSFPTYSIKYYDPVANTASYTAPASIGTLAPVQTGVNRGLMAAQLPIQVMAVSELNKAVASVADAIRIDLIPIFQFAIFTDGDFELQNPATMEISGRVHSNGNFYMVNGGQVATFRSPVTVAGKIFNRASFLSSVGVAAGQTLLPNSATTVVPLRALATEALPEAANDDQATYLRDTFGPDFVKDSTLGQTRLEVPIQITGLTECANNAACTGPTSVCVKKVATDDTGVCQDLVASRPNQCSVTSRATNDKSVAANANFAQSSTIELIRRPRKMYGLDANNIYDVVTRTYYGADYGPQPTHLTAAPGDNDPAYLNTAETTVPKSVPLVNVVEADDDQGAVKERFFWKADIRIIDGVWYKKGSNTPVFDPETWPLASGFTSVDVNAATGNVSLGHKYARVLRYSWFWDPRETRVYGTGANMQRGAQIRTTDFDVAAFNALLNDSTARTQLFGGSIPANGPIVYISETYDPRFEDSNSSLPRAANVRNYLNAYVMENHIPAGTAIPVQTGARGVNTKTPTERGWWPSNIWGKSAPVNFRSLTPAQAFTTGATVTVAPNVITLLPADNELRNFYRDPILYENLSAFGSGFECQEPSLLTAAPIPTVNNRTTGAAEFRAPCIQAGATPLGPENAIRIVRGYQVPTNGLTIATDNRAYILGDVNVISTGGTGTTVPFGAANVATRQDIPGKVSIIADSVTLLSARFSDRLMQRGGGRANTSHLNRKARFSSVDASIAAVPTTRPWNTEAPAEEAADDTTLVAGRAPNLCTIGEPLSTSVHASPALYMRLPSGFPAATALRKALPTKFNISMLMGDVPACIDGGNADGSKSGGLNNFPRFLENWTNVENVIHGSIVSLFRSERGNSRFLNAAFDDDFDETNTANWRADLQSSVYGAWSTPCVYAPPNRVWGFDVGLQNPANLPAGTPRVFATDRLRWVRR